MKQRGIALLAGLVLLTAISLLALSASSGMILQRNMTMNFQENSLALQNASIASEFAVAWLNSRPVIDRESACEEDCLLPIGIHAQGELPAQPEFESVEWWRSNAFETGYNPEKAETITTPDRGAEPARWIIEEIYYQLTGDVVEEGRAESVAYYRIFSRGTGRNSRSVAVTETITARPWEGDFDSGDYPPTGPLDSFCDQFESRYDCGRLSWRQRR